MNMKFSNVKRPMGVESTPSDVILGPVVCTAVEFVKVAKEYVQGVGLTAHMIKSVNPCVGKDDFISITFLKASYAEQFVSLMGYRDIYGASFMPLAIFVDQWAYWLEAISAARSHLGLTH